MTAFSPSAQRCQRIGAAIAAEGIASLLIADKLNFAYATGHFSREFDKRFRTMLAAVDRDGRAQALVPAGEAGALQSASPEIAVHSYAEASADAAVRGFLSTLAAATQGTIAVEFGVLDRPCIPAGAYHELLGRPVVDGSRLLLACRVQKDPYEQACLVEAARISQDAWISALRRFRVGISCEDVKNILAAELCLKGSDFNVPGHVEALDASTPGKAIIGLGDIVWCDFGASFRGYQADLSRRAVFGDPTPSQRHNHESGVQLLGLLAKQLRPSIPCSVAVNHVLGRYARVTGTRDVPTGRLGHGIGLCASEPPSLSSTEAMVLQPGMILTPEPSFRAADGEFVHVEEMVVVTETGCEFLSSGASTLYRVETTP